MKLIFIVVMWLLLTFKSYSQTVYPISNTGFLGTSVNSNLTSDVFFQFESKSDWVKLQLTYLTDLQLKEQRFNAKMGFRPIFWRKEKLEFWMFIPYLNMNLKPIGYNSPFSFELQWKDKLALILDTGLKDVNVQIRYRTKIFQSEKTFKK